VYLFDGTTVTMPDTPANQAAYPQVYNQGPGVGFPIARLGALISLACGAVVGRGFARYAGKGEGEVSVLRRIWGVLAHGDVLLADRLSARRKLNQLHATGSAVLAGGLGLAFQSWWAFDAGREVRAVLVRAEVARGDVLDGVAVAVRVGDGAARVGHDRGGAGGQRMEVMTAISGGEVHEERSPGTRRGARVTA
jgi:hypothetical protein